MNAARARLPADPARTLSARAEDRVRSVPLGDPDAPGSVRIMDLAARTSRLMGVDTDGGPADSSATSPSPRPDGTEVALGSYAADLVPGDTHGTTDGFVRHLR